VLRAIREADENQEGRFGEPAEFITA
jgi:hypothetical protein